MIVKTYADLLVAKKFIESQSTLAFDIESTGLSTRNDKIIGFSISNAEQAYYFLHLSFDDSSLKEYLNIKQIQSVLELLKPKKLIGWNSAFDIPFTYNYFKVDLLDSLWSDAMLAKHTTDEEYPFALKECAKKEFGESAVSEQNDLLTDLESKGASKNELYKANYEIIAKYCMQDAKLTYRLNELYMQRMKQDGLLNFFLHDEVMPLYRLVTIPMEQRGIRLNLPLLHKTQTEIAKDIETLEAQIKSLLAPHTDLFLKWFLNKDYPAKRSGSFAQTAAIYFNADLPKTASGAPSLAAKAISALPEDSRFKQWFNAAIRLNDSEILDIQKLMHGPENPLNLQSKYHLKKIFFDTLGEIPLSTTETGLPQLDDDFLESVKHKYEFVPLLLDYNKLNKIKSTYIDRFVDEQENGRFYPRFLMHGTISGRLSGDFQQLPRPKQAGELSDLVLKYNNTIRAFFISNEGNSFIDSDYESLEPHVFAHVSNDDNIRNIFRQGHDFYSTIAIMTEGLQDVSADKNASNYLGKVNKQKRQSAKGYSLGIPYGMSAYKLHFELGISKSEAEQLVKNYLNAFPNLAKWMDNTKQQVLRSGRVKTETGRVRRMPLAKRHYADYGDTILDGLKLYDKYKDNSAKYKQMKEIYSRVRNYVNNANNFQIQGLAASIVNRAAIKICKYFKDNNIPCYIVAQTHDQICYECPDALVPECSKVIQDFMENTYKISVPLKAPPTVAKNLYESH